MEGSFQNGFRKLLAWKESHALTVNLYRLTEKFPKREQYGIISQLQRAASSIGAQIAEGSRMPTQAHRKLYYDRAYASAAEVDNFLELAKDLEYLTHEDHERLLRMVNRCSYLLLQLSRSCK